MWEREREILGRLRRPSQHGNPSVQCIMNRLCWVIWRKRNKHRVYNYTSIFISGLSPRHCCLVQNTVSSAQAGTRARPSQSALDMRSIRRLYTNRTITCHARCHEATGFPTGSTDRRFENVIKARAFQNTISIITTLPSFECFHTPVWFTLPLLNITIITCHITCVTHIHTLTARTRLVIHSKNTPFCKIHRINQCYTYYWQRVPIVSLLVFHTFL